MGVSLLPEVRPSSYPESSEAGFPPVKEDIVFQEEGTLGADRDCQELLLLRSESLLCQEE